MGGGTAAHVYDLHIIVAVYREMDKTGMQPDIDQLSFFQHFTAVHNEIRSGGIQVFLDILAAV